MYRNRHHPFTFKMHLTHKEVRRRIRKSIGERRSRLRALCSNTAQDRTHQHELRLSGDGAQSVGFEIGAQSRQRGRQGRLVVRP
jgi:hypothetical protein